MKQKAGLRNCFGRNTSKTLSKYSDVGVSRFALTRQGVGSPVVGPLSEAEGGGGGGG